MFKLLNSFLMLIFVSSVSVGAMLPAHRCEANLMYIHTHYVSTVTKFQDLADTLTRLKQFREWELRETQPPAHTQSLKFSSMQTLSAQQKMQLAGRIRGIEIDAQQATVERPTETRVTTDVAVITGIENIMSYVASIHNTMDILQGFSDQKVIPQRRRNVLWYMGFVGLDYLIYGTNVPNAMFLGSFLGAEMDEEIRYQIKRFRENSRRKNDGIPPFLIQNTSGWYYDAQNFTLHEKLVKELRRHFLDPERIGKQDLWAFRSFSRRILSRIFKLDANLGMGTPLWVGLDRYFDFDHEGQPRLTLIARTSPTQPNFAPKSKVTENEELSLGATQTAL